MPRIRTIKPEFWSDEKVMAVSRDARLLFVGLWNYSDDDGVMKNSHAEIKARIFPGDDDTDVPGWLGELIGVGLVLSYEVEGRTYLQCKNLRKHQVIDKPRKSGLPPCPPPVPPTEINGNQLISTDFSPGREGKGREVCVGKNFSEGAAGEMPPQESPPTPTPVFSSPELQVNQAEFEELCRVNPELSREQVLSEIGKAGQYARDHPRRHRRRADGRLREGMKFLRDWLDRAEAAGQARDQPMATPAQVMAPIITPENAAQFADPTCTNCGGKGMTSQKMLRKVIQVKCDCVDAQRGTA